MKKHISKNLLILPFALALMASCSGKKAASPTSFKLSGLSAITADSATVPGGVVLMGSNGTDKFTAGIRPSDLTSFSLDLPVGSWNFSAIAWQGAAPMTGATQCGLSTTTIEGTSMVVSLTLSAANCQQSAFASPAAFSLGSPNFFKTLTINSCLNPVGKTIGDICDGSDLAQKSDLPGESMSFRVQVSSGSSFGAALPPLNSACYNISGLPTNQLISGVVNTPLTLPYGGSINMPLRIVGYEKPNCPIEDISGIYPVEGGFQGTMGVDRTVDTSLAEQLFVSIADNFVGVTGSPFLNGHTTAQMTLPFPSCGNTCFDTPDNSRNNTELWLSTRDAAWSLFGSPDGRNSYDFEPDTISPGSMSIFNVGGEISFTTLPNNGSSIEFFYYDTPGAPTSVLCTPGFPPSQGQVEITYDSTTYTFSEVVTAMNAQPNCADTVMVTLVADGSGTISGGSVLQPTITAGAYIAKRRELGSLKSAIQTLVGPVGAALAKNGISTFAQLCSAPTSGYSLNLPTGEVVDIQLSNATPSAVYPSFPSSPAGQFEKKVLIIFNGQPEEAFYFNCSINTGLGAVVDREIDGSDSYIEQVFWDIGATDLWVEKVSYSEEPSQGRSWREYQSAHIAGDIVKIWGMGTDLTFSHKFVSYVDLFNSKVFAQNSTFLADTNPDFVSGANDDEHDLTTGSYIGMGPLNTMNPTYVTPLLFDTTLDSFINEDPLAPFGVWDLSF